MSHNLYFSLILSGQPPAPVKSLMPLVKQVQLLVPLRISVTVQPFLLPVLCHSVQPYACRKPPPIEIYSLLLVL